jgi:protein required for attachment to host cells
MLIPHKALIVVADGTHARFLRNMGRETKIQLLAEGELKPAHLLREGPAGRRPKESPPRETHEAIFAKQLAQELFRRVQNRDFEALILVADPQTLGEIRPSLHKEVQSRLISEIAKTLTKASVADIQKALS